jgi:hypothetical protein
MYELAKAFKRFGLSLSPHPTPPWFTSKASNEQQQYPKKV